MKPRITTAREQFDMLSPWLITAAPPAFDKVYSDDGEFIRRERPQDFPALSPKPEVEELAEPPKVRTPNFQTYELSDGTVVKQHNNPTQQTLFPQNESLTSGIPWVSEAPDPGRFKKVKPSPQELPEGWEAIEVGDGKKKTEITVSPEGNRYRTIDGDTVQVGEDGKPLSTPEGERPPPSGYQSALSPEEESKGGAPIDPDNEWDSRNPDGQGFHESLARFLVPDELERSLIAKYNASDKGTREAGGQWYDTANEYIHNLAQKAGIDPSKVGAIVSAFSPQTSWDQNMAAANYFIMNFDPENPDAIDDKMGGLGDNLERAKRIYAADDEEGYLAGLQNGNDAHKITNFYHNLMGSKDHVTIDSWMARALLGEGAEGLADKSVQKVLNWKDGYDTMANSVRSAAQKLGISPRELQAIVWSQVVPTAGSYEELTPQERAKKEQQRTKYIERSPDSKILPDYFHGPGWRAAPEPTYPNKKPFSPGYLNGPLPANDNTAFYKRGRFWQRHAVEDWNAVEDHIRGQQYPGFTLRNELGDAPTSGYMVSLPGHEQVRPYDEKALARGDKNNVWTSDVPMSAETLKQFNTDKSQVINSDPDNKQGGWEDDGDWFDDVSRHYTDIYDAAKQAYGETPEEAQHGFYDIKNEISPSPLEFMYKGEPAFFMARRLWKG